MPIYEYGCKKCGHRFELIRRLATRDDPAPCPECRSKTPKRIEIQRVAVLHGARPDALAGEGEPEDFMGGDFGGDDFGGGDFGGDDLDMGF